MKQWFTPADLAALALPGMPTTERAIQLMAQRENWKRPEWQWPTNEQGRWRRREARGGGIEYHYSLLPTRARAKVVAVHMTAAPVDERAEAKADLTQREMWEFFDRLPEKKKEKARERLAALDEINALILSGMPKDIACQMVAVQRGIKSVQEIALILGITQRAVIYRLADKKTDPRQIDIYDVLGRPG